MTKEELKKEAEEKYNERLKQNGIKVEYRNETYTDGYLDGAEPREKRIVELEMTVGTLRTFSNEQATCIERFEKENKVLAQNLEDTEILNKTYEKRFKDLEKEVTELKLKLEALEGQTPWKDIKDKSEVIGQLTNAKEIIKKLKALYLSPVVTNDDVKRQDEILNEAEQFLKDLKK